MYASMSKHWRYSFGWNSINIVFHGGAQCERNALSFAFPCTQQPTIRGSPITIQYAMYRHVFPFSLRCKLFLYALYCNLLLPTSNKHEYPCCWLDYLFAQIWQITIGRGEFWLLNLLFVTINNMRILLNKNQLHIYRDHVNGLPSGSTHILIDNFLYIFSLLFCKSKIEHFLHYKLYKKCK